MPFLIGALFCFVLASFNGRGWGYNIRATAIGFFVTLVPILILMRVL